MSRSRVAKIGIGMIALVAIALAGFYVYKGGKDEELDTSSNASSSQRDTAERWGNKNELLSLFANKIASTTNEAVTTKTNTAGGQVKSDPEMNLSVKQIKKQLTQEYTNKDLGFSFQYPTGFRIGVFDSGQESTTVLLQHPSNRVGLQVVVTQLDETVNLTTNLIQKELPTYLLINPQPVRINGKKRGVVFKSKNQAFGKSREIWFTHGKKLYQITSYASLDPFIKAVFETWQFQ